MTGQRTIAKNVARLCRPTSDYSLAKVPLILFTGVVAAVVPMAGCLVPAGMSGGHGTDRQGVGHPGGAATDQQPADGDRVLMLAKLTYLLRQLADASLGDERLRSGIRSGSGMDIRTDREILRQISSHALRLSLMTEAGASGAAGCITGLAPSHRPYVTYGAGIAALGSDINKLKNPGTDLAGVMEKIRAHEPGIRALDEFCRTKGDLPPPGDDPPVEIQDRIPPPHDPPDTTPPGNPPGTEPPGDHPPDTVPPARNPPDRGPDYPR